MPGVNDALLVALIGLLTVGLLIFIVVYGSNITIQLENLTQNFTNSLLTVEVTFVNLTGNAIDIFAGLATVTGQAFAFLVPQIVQAFAAIGDYFADQLRAIVKQVQNNVFGTTSSLSNMILSGMSSVGSAFSTTIIQLENFFFSIQQALLSLVNDAETFVVTIVTAIINQIVNGISYVIGLVIGPIITAADEVKKIIVDGIAEAEAALTTVETFFDSSWNTLNKDLSSLYSDLVVFGETLLSTFGYIPRELVCLIRCVCHVLPGIGCPLNCCCGCGSCDDSCAQCNSCPDNSCANCVSGSCVQNQPCEDICFFPNGCCQSTANNICAVCGC
jgi:hypothetical protein